MNKNLNEKEKIARKIVDYSKDEILISYSFFGVTFLEMEQDWEADISLGLKNGRLSLNTEEVCHGFEESPVKFLRSLLHSLLHFVFAHDITYGIRKRNGGEMTEREWNLATDIVTEAVALSLSEEKWELEEDAVKSEFIGKWKEKIVPFTPEKVYDFLKKEHFFAKEEAYCQRVEALFCMDSHEGFFQEVTEPRKEKERKLLSTKVKTDMETFSKHRKKDVMMLQLREATRDKKDYKTLLQKFAMPTENRYLSPDEMDLVYYCYGLSLFENIPLIEPVEYTEDTKIRDFVIAIDTSGSTAGAMVQNFLDRTYSVLQTTECFGEECNIHVIQCDDRVRKDTKIKNPEEMDRYIKKLQITGFGGTDFRPAFEYVEELRKKGELSRLKGLIYFTDGRGTYPSKAPGYPVLFVLANTGYDVQGIPPWAAYVILEEELETIPADEQR